MPHPSPDPHHDNPRANEQLQVQRERLRQALLSGARLDDAIDLMCAMRALLPMTARKQGQRRVAGRLLATRR